MSEERLMAIQEGDTTTGTLIDDFETYFRTFPTIPWSMMKEDFDENMAKSFQNEFRQILKYYYVYKQGMDFSVEGSNGDYTPSKLRYKKAAMLLNKEARFCFANPPTFSVNIDDISEENAEDYAVIQNYLDKVFEKTKFFGKLLKGIKDSFIGKRIGIVVNFTAKNTITITFLKSTNFMYEFDENDELTKFISFYEITGSEFLSEQKWYRKVYEKDENDKVWFKEEIHDGVGEVIEVVSERTEIKLDYIPAVVVLNDGLSGDKRGVSELTYLMDYEEYYSKLANSDMDSERKTMHPIRYTIDASQDSTKNLSTSPGSYWDIQTDTDKPTDTSQTAKVGIIETNMNYSEPLKTTLERIENEMYSAVDVPNITSDQLAGVITSGKTIQALYWGLTVRCDEKMLQSWSDALIRIANAIIDGGRKYKSCAKTYSDVAIPDIEYEVFVENNYPIPEDVKEEKETDLLEIDAKVMSRKSYLKKWRGLTSLQADEELEQIKMESEMLDNTYLNYSTDNVKSIDEENKESVENENADENKNDGQQQNSYTRLQENESPNARNVE